MKWLSDSYLKGRSWNGIGPKGDIGNIITCDLNESESIYEI